MAVPGLKAQRVHGVVTGVAQAVVGACCDNDVVHGRSISNGGIQLPAKLADVAHTKRLDRGACDVDGLHRGETEALVRHVGRSQGLQQLSSVGTHDPNDGVIHRDVGDFDIVVAASSP